MQLTSLSAWYTPPHSPNLLLTPPLLIPYSPAHLLTCSPPHLLTSSPPHLLTSSPPHLLTSSPPHLLTLNPSLILPKAEQCKARHVPVPCLCGVDSEECEGKSCSLITVLHVVCTFLSLVCSHPLPSHMLFPQLISL